MAKAETFVTLYRIDRGWLGDREDPIKVNTAKAKVVPSGYKIIEGRAEFSYRTYVATDSFATKLDGAMEAAQQAAKNRLAQAVQDQRQTVVDIAELNKLALKLKRKGQCPSCKPR